MAPWVRRVLSAPPGRAVMSARQAATGRTANLACAVCRVRAGCPVPLGREGWQDRPALPVKLGHRELPALLGQTDLKATRAQPARRERRDRRGFRAQPERPVRKEPLEPPEPKGRPAFLGRKARRGSPARQELRGFRATSAHKVRSERPGRRERPERRAPRDRSA